MDEYKYTKTKDPFGDDILNDAISEEMKKRSDDRAARRERRAKEAEKKRVAAENRKARQKIAFVVAAILLIIIAVFSKSVVQIIDLKAEKEAAEARLLALQEHIERLNEELNRVTSDEYIEQQARQQLRMIYPGEVLYILLDK